MMLIVLRMAQADRYRWGARIMLQTLREMENAFRALKPLKRRRKVNVSGSARTAIDHPIYRLARELGATLLPLQAAGHYRRGRRHHGRGA